MGGGKCQHLPRRPLKYRNDVQTTQLTKQDRAAGGKHQGRFFIANVGRFFSLVATLGRLVLPSPPEGVLLAFALVAILEAFAFAIKLMACIRNLDPEIRSTGKTKRDRGRGKENARKQWQK